jgi:hypothetical protein
LLDIGFGELGELLNIYVHPSVVIGLVANFTLDVWHPYIQVDTSFIFNLFIHRVLLFLLVMNLLALLLRSNLWCGSSLLMFFHHIAMIILRRLHLSLLLQLVYFNFKPLDFSL